MEQIKHRINQGIDAHLMHDMLSKPMFLHPTFSMGKRKLHPRKPHNDAREFGGIFFNQSVPSTFPRYMRERRGDRLTLQDDGKRWLLNLQLLKNPHGFWGLKLCPHPLAILELL